MISSLVHAIGWTVGRHIGNVVWVLLVGAVVYGTGHSAVRFLRRRK